MASGWCSLNRTLRTLDDWASGYGYAPTTAQHRAVCAVLPEPLREAGRSTALGLGERPDLDRAAHARRGDAGGDLHRGVEIVGLEEAVAADGLLHLRERPVRLSVVPSCTRTVVAMSGGCIRAPGVTPGVSSSAL